jgi:uracil-DNA glycosylase family 4
MIGADSPSGRPGGLLARYLRQRLEAGEGPLPLMGSDARSCLAMADAGSRHPGAPLSLAARTPGSPPAGSHPAMAAPPAGGELSSPAVRATSSAAGAAPGATPAGGGEASGPGGVTSDAFQDLAALATACRECTRCGLARTRTRVVVGDGNAAGRVMVVGEAPGANEDATGLPFVGAAGKLLDLLLATVDLSREENVYIANVIKCRPPGNRNPTADEIATCSPWLRGQIALVRPEAILAVGTFAGQLLTGRSDALGKLRGQVFRHEGTPLVVTYHPAALLRNSGWIAPTWHDLQLLRRVLSGEAPLPSEPAHA